MNAWPYAVWGFVTAALFAYGVSGIIFREKYRYAIPSALAGVALYAAMWWFIP